MTPPCLRRKLKFRGRRVAVHEECYLLFLLNREMGFPYSFAVNNALLCYGIGVDDRMIRDDENEKSRWRYVWASHRPKVAGWKRKWLPSPVVCSRLGMPHLMQLHRWKQYQAMHSRNKND